MKITFLIGNGFDLQAGLRTGYEDFLQSYIEKESKTAAIRRFKKELRQDLETWSDFELAMGNYTKVFSEKNLKQFVDIMDDVRQNLMEYLQQEESSACYDGREEEIAEEMRRTLQFVVSSPGTYIRLQKDKASSEQKMHVEKKGVKKNPAKDPVAGHVLSQSPRPQSVQCHFISFNYTRVFDRCLALTRAAMEKDEKNGAVFELEDAVHIHGTTEGHSLLGVNDESQIANRQAAFNEWFQCRFIKPLSNESLRGMDDKRAVQWIQESDMICIFGMSMGKTDGFWWKLICRWLKEKGNRYLSIFSGNGNDNEKGSQKFIEEKVKNQFFEASGLNADEEEGLNAQIYTASARGLFELKLR